MNGQTRLLLLLIFGFLAFAEASSWVTASWPGDCLVNPEQGPRSSNDANQKDCPTFIAGSLILLKRADRVIGRHDKSIVAVFTVVLAVSTIGLWIATLDLFRAGEKQMQLIALKLWPIAKGEMWSGIAVRAMADGEKHPSDSNPTNDGGG